MNKPPHEPAILQGARRVRYLKLIALFKIAKGALLLVLGVSLVFLNARTRWMDALSNWIADEILLEHSKAVAYFAPQTASGACGRHCGPRVFWRFFYSAVLFTEGIGVYMQQRWAELLMIFATASLIPLEVRHLWHRPGLVGVLILLANCFIVWFLYRVLKRDKAKCTSRIRPNWSKHVSDSFVAPTRSQEARAPI
jgi:Predicted membrane protein